MTVKISIDCMSGDYGLSVTIPAVLSFLHQNLDSELILVGQEKLLRAALYKYNTKSIDIMRIKIQHAMEVILMNDSIEIALRHKKNSSMHVAVSLVKNSQADVAVSAGNTGALIAVSHYVLKTIPGINRPAICTIFPTQKNSTTYMLDLGANVNCEPQHLHQFALMGSALVSAIKGKFRPSIGLLNVGEEIIKGNKMVKNAAKLLYAAHKKGILNFYGNVEGNDIFEGTTDIIICDGFVGNITLKASEGFSRFVKKILLTEFKKGFFNKLGACIASNAIQALSHRLNPSRYNGASLLGLRGLVFKSHGSADIYAFEWAIRHAYNAVKCNVLSRITTTMTDLIPWIKTLSIHDKINISTNLIKKETV